MQVSVSVALAKARIAVQSAGVPAVATFAAGLPQQTVELCFSQLDADGDGRVSFRDFATMMSTLRPDGRAAGLVAPAAARFAGAGGAPRTTQPLATM